MPDARMDSSEEEKESSEAVKQAFVLSFSPDVEIRPVEQPERNLCADNSSGHYKHHVFISHRGKYKPEVAFPIMAIFTYFCDIKFAAFDEVTLEIGNTNCKVISKALSESVHCLALISDDFFESKWTIAEVGAFFEAIEKEGTQSQRKVIPLFIGLSPGDCGSLNMSGYCDKNGVPLSEEVLHYRQKIAKQLSALSGREQARSLTLGKESVEDFILKQMPDLMKNHLRVENNPVLLPEFHHDINPVLLRYVYREAVSYYKKVHGKVNMTNLLELLRKQRLQTSLRAGYEPHRYLARLFDKRETDILIADSFINLALIKEKEHRKKEKSLGGGANLEEKDENKKEFIDERMASHEELYVVREPLALNQLFEPNDDTQTPNKLLILGRAGIGKSVLCQYLAVQWAFESESTDEEQKGELGNYLRQKFDAVFWVRLREVAAGSPAHDTVAKVINQFCLRGLNNLSLEELDFYIKSRSKKILFILDGYDEITDSIGYDRCTHLTNFLNELATNQHENILITSRPLAIDTLGQGRITFNRKLENIGFTNENIEAYVRLFMTDAKKPDQAEPMLKFLKTHPSIWGIAHIPINLNLLNWSWLEGDLKFKEGQIITLSKLYQLIVDRVQITYAEKSSQLSKREDGTFVPDKQVDEFLQNLAYLAMQDESLLIPKSQLKQALEKTLKKYHSDYHEYHCIETNQMQLQLLKSATNKLGFLRGIQEDSLDPLDQHHYFIHLSFQEFYAAKYITRILSNPIENEEKIRVIQHIITEKYMPRYQLMLWMTVGLLYQQGVQQGREFSALEQFWQAILSEPRDILGFHHMVLVMHCLDECEADQSLALHKALIEQHLQWLHAYCDSYGTYGGYGGRRYELYDRELACCPLLQGSKLVVDYWLKILQDEEKRVRQNVMQRPRQAFKEAFKKLGQLQNPSETVVITLFNALKDKDWSIKHSAFEELRYLENPSKLLIVTFLNASKDKDRWIRNHAILALGRLQNVNRLVITVLLTALKDEDKGISKNALQILDSFNFKYKLRNPKKAMITALLKALKDENKQVRQKAVELLAYLLNCSGTFITALVNASKNEDVEVSHSAILTLSQHQNPANALKYKNNGIINNYTAKKALEHPSQSSSETIIRVLKEALSYKMRDVDVREITVTTLRRLPNPNKLMVHLLLDFFEDNNRNKYSNPYKRPHIIADENDAVIAILAPLETDQIAIVFERLMHSRLLSIYLSSFFKENHLFCIDHENKQLILSLYNKIHKISSFSHEMLIHLEKQIRNVAKEREYPLDIIDGKEVRVLQEQIKGSHFPAVSSSSRSSQETPLNAYQRVKASKNGEYEAFVRSLPEDSQMQCIFSTHYLQKICPQERMLNDGAAIEEKELPQLLPSSNAAAALVSSPAVLFNSNRSGYLSKRKEPNPFSTNEAQQDGQEDDTVMRDAIQREDERSVQRGMELSQLTQQRDIFQEWISAPQKRGKTVPSKEAETYKNVLDRITKLESTEVLNKRRKTGHSSEQKEWVPQNEVRAEPARAVAVSHAEEVSRREPTSSPKMFSNESEKQILKRLKAILDDFNHCEIEEEAMRHAICAFLESFKNGGSSYSLNSNRMFRIIQKLLYPEKIVFKTPEAIVKCTISGEIPETEKDKIRKKVADSEFYNVFFEEIAKRLGIKFFLADENVQQFSHVM